MQAAKAFHNIEISMFIKPEENAEKLKDAFIRMFPFDAAIDEQIHTHDDRPIQELKIRLQRAVHIRKFSEHLFEHLGPQRKQLAQEVDARLDERLDFFIRLDKDALLEDKYQLTEKGNCVHIRCTMAVWPKKRELALDALKGVLEQETI